MWKYQRKSPTLHVHSSLSPVSCRNDAQCLLPMMSDVFCQCLPRPHARHLGRLCSLSSKFSCPYHAPPLARVFLYLLLVITLLWGSSSPFPHARHHFVLMLVSSAEVFSEGWIKKFRRVIWRQISGICSIVPQALVDKSISLLNDLTRIGN